MSDDRASAPLVSVIVPAFNAAATIEQSLDSALAQTHRHLEVIVVDDGSSDLTASVVERLAAGDSRIRLIRIENGAIQEGGVCLIVGIGSHPCHIYWSRRPRQPCGAAIRQRGEI